MIIVQFGVEIGIDYTRKLISWDDDVTSNQTLKMFSLSAYSKIDGDIKKLRKFNIIKDSKHDDFQQTPYSYLEYKCVYIYRHKDHSSFSNVTFSTVSKLCNVIENSNHVDPCAKPACHDKYSPYCYGNRQLKSILNELQKNKPELVEKIKTFQEITSNEYFSDTSMACCNYLEDDWTKRLYICLGLNNIDSDFTALFRGRSVRNTWLHKLPPHIGSKSLLFQGAPDIIINKIKSTRKEGMCVVNSCVEEEQDSSQDSSQDSLQDSQNSGRLQMGHQVFNTASYVAGSFIPDKAGELVAALHASLVCRALRRCKREKVFYPLTAHGLHIHRTVGIIHIEVTLSQETMQVIATELFEGSLSPEYLCPSINYLMDKLKKNEF